MVPVEEGCIAKTMDYRSEILAKGLSATQERQKRTALITKKKNMQLQRLAKNKMA